MGKRNRIVIDLNAQAQAQSRTAGSPRRSGGARRILGIIGIFLLLIIAGVAIAGFFWWRHYQKQPNYSVALLVDAAQRNDSAEMDRLLDIDKISDDFISQVRQKAAATSSVVDAIPQARLDQAAAIAAPKLKKTLHEELPGEIKRLTESAAGKPFALIAVAMPYFLNVKEDGNTARAEAKIKDEQIQLTLQKVAEGTWRIVAIRDDRLAGIVADNIRKDLSPARPQLQDDVERKLKDLKWPAP
jgi:hypothetical protein